MLCEYTKSCQMEGWWLRHIWIHFYNDQIFISDLPVDSIIADNFDLKEAFGSLKIISNDKNLKTTAALVLKYTVTIGCSYYGFGFSKIDVSKVYQWGFYFYRMNRGFIFDIFYPLLLETLEVTKSNPDSVLAVQNTKPNNKESSVLKYVFPNLSLIRLVYVWSTIVIEFIVALAILWKPKRRRTHLLFIAMILGILCTSLEMGFIGWVPFSGLFL